MDKLKGKKVICAVSGGIDSALAAALLKETGCQLKAVFLKLWPGSVKEELTRVRQLADNLKIPLAVFDFRKEFKKEVIDYFLKEYRQGRTPNPCVVCNQKIKFGLLLKKSLAERADYLASGHYARRVGPELFRAKDKSKDQSYFLWTLKQTQLKHILFPLGNYRKKKVRELAKKFKLPFSNIPESQEICFIEKGLDNFLASHLRPKPGKIIDLSGREIGRHRGLVFYTIGQRKGLEMSGGPFYVVKKNLAKNILIVAHLLKESNLYQKELRAKQVNWIYRPPSSYPSKIKAQIRYRHKAVTAKLNKKNRYYHLDLAKRQRAITPGQSVVFYQGENCLGGGIIV